jgi:DNA-binding MarR family transcriptional regulator
MNTRRARGQEDSQEIKQGSAPRPGTWPAPAPLAEAHGPVTHTIFRISRKNRAMVANLLRPIGLFPGQELLLMQLWERDARPQRDLVESLGIDHSTVTKMLQRMQAAGLIQRCVSADDRRVVVVSLTDEGRRLRGEVERIWKQMEHLMVGHLSDQQRRELLRLLDTVEAQLQPGRASC